MEKLLRRILNNLLEKCKMGKINNTSTYAISAPVVATDIVIGSALGVGGDTKNFLMSDISAYVIGNVTVPTLNQVCASGNVTSTSLDINNTADIADTLTLSKPSGTGLQVVSNAIIGGSLTALGATLTNAGLAVNGSGGIIVGSTSGITSFGPIAGTILSSSGGLLVSGTSLLGVIDASGVADIADTLTLSKVTGTGLQVDSDAIIDGTLTVNTTASFTDAGSSISASGLISTAGNILALGTVGGAFLLTDSANAPASAAAAGTAGSIVADANYIYVCTATNTWKRVGIATW
jgi:hypothetical protein